LQGDQESPYQKGYNGQKNNGAALHAFFSSF
jgi:hypothetical protein